MIALDLPPRMTRELGRAVVRLLTLACLTLGCAPSAASQEGPHPVIGKWRFQHETPFSSPLIILNAETLVVRVRLSPGADGVAEGPLTPRWWTVFTSDRPSPHLQRKVSGLDTTRHNRGRGRHS
jgi:hypothetical protein